MFLKEKVLAELPKVVVDFVRVVAMLDVEVQQSESSDDGRREKGKDEELLHVVSHSFRTNQLFLT